MSWSVLIDRARPGWENMAIDLAMLDHTTATGEALLRCYQWDPHTLSFGRHEPARSRYDTDRIRRERIPCVRRPTGGRAVWHARELTYAVSAPIALYGGMREAYAAIHALLAAAIGALGLRTTLAPSSGRPSALGSGPCFAAPVGGEVMVAGRKAVGSAQLRSGEMLLQHGSVLLQDDQRLVRELAGLEQADPAEVPLATALGRPVTFDEASRALHAAARGLWGDDMASLEELPATIAADAAHHAARFQSEEWTWQR